MIGSLNVQVRDSLINPNDGSGPAWRNSSGDRPLYQVHIYLEGPDLPYVKSVTYTLHPTFKERVRKVARAASNPNCILTIWTWGLFDIAVDVEDKRGQIYNSTYDLRYGDEISKTPQSKFRSVS